MSHYINNKKFYYIMYKRDILKTPESIKKKKNDLDL